MATRPIDIYTYEPTPGEMLKWDVTLETWVVVDTEHSLAVKRLEALREAYSRWFNENSSFEDSLVFQLEFEELLHAPLE